jgi:TetR/AcrR family transcriptional regulator
MRSSSALNTSLVARRILQSRNRCSNALVEPAGRRIGRLRIALASDRLANISRNPGLSRTILLEVLQNEEFRDSIAKLWQQHIWRPMVEGLEDLRAKGFIRKDVDLEVLARSIHCLHIGYFLVRFVFAPDRKWDDVGEIAKMAEILTHGSTKK